MTDESAESSNEYLVGVAMWKGKTINITNLGRYIVEIYMIPYPAKSLDEATGMIDELYKSLAN